MPDDNPTLITPESGGEGGGDTSLLSGDVSNPESTAKEAGAKAEADKVVDADPKTGESEADPKESITDPEKEAKEKAEKDAADDKPIEYKDFSLPEGFQADDTLLGKFKEVAAEAKLPQDQAQKMVDLYVAAEKELQTRNQNLWADTNKQWQDTVKADPELGGVKFDENMAAVAKAINQFGGKETAAIKSALSYTGAGNNPEIVRLISRLAKASTEGSHVNGNPTSNAPKDAAKILYPDQP